jgi:hypothetical protein
MRTQKARGIAALLEHQNQLRFNGQVTPLPYVLISEIGELGFLNDWPRWPAFGRCCPEWARHGFVGSRPIWNIEDARKLFLEARGADPRAELIVMPYVDASHNAVWTPGRLIVGEGNEGATSGNNSVSISTTKDHPVSGETLVKASGLPPSDVPYMEFVRPKGGGVYEWHIVQVRGGPDVSDIGDDFLPGPITCKRVIEVNGEELLEWEAKVKTLKAGDFVYHKGGSLGSHYGVHTKLSGLPYFSKREPRAGKKYDLCSCPAPKPKLAGDWCSGCDGYRGFVKELDVDEAVKGISHGMVLDLYQPDVTFPYENAAKLLLGANHNVAFFGQKESRLLGAAVSMTLRLGMSACFGEATHKGYRFIRHERDYYKAWSNVAESFKHFNEARQKFYEKGWRSSYGGKAWAQCANATAELWNLTVKFVRSKSLDDLKAVAKSLNATINLAHNTGWWFDKFISKEWFAISVKSPASPLIATAHIVYSIMQADIEVSGLVSQMEKVASGQGAQAFQPKPFGPFVVSYRPNFGKPWVTTFSDGQKRHNAGLRGVAKNYLEVMGETKPSEARIKEVLSEISRAMGPKPKRKSGLVEREVADDWTIPDLSKSKSSAPAIGREVKAAQAALRGSTLHVQIVYVDQEHYERADVPLSLDQLVTFNKWWPKSEKRDSLAGSDTQYAVLEVMSDGIYAGPLRVVLLKNKHEVVL